MKRFRLTLVLLATALTVSSSWTTETSSYLQWHADRKLDWDDFQGQPDHSSHADAAAAVHISAKPFYYKKKLHYKVEAYFIPAKSWYREQSAELLRHEQLHFDIAELYARKVRKKITEYAQMGVRDVNDYNDAIRRVLAESNTIDMKYDFSTLHGSNTNIQRQWEKEIELELSILERFSSEHWR